MDAPLTPLVTECNDSFLCFLQAIHCYTHTATALKAAFVKADTFDPIEKALFWGAKAAECEVEHLWESIRAGGMLLCAFPDSGVWRATLAAEQGGAA